jgi:hypothetical protein
MVEKRNAHFPFLDRGMSLQKLRIKQFDRTQICQSNGQKLTTQSSSHAPVFSISILQQPLRFTINCFTPLHSIR